jgi:hypothetical protein
VRTIDFVWDLLLECHQARSRDRWHWFITQIVEHPPASHDGFAKFSSECLAMWPQRHTLTRFIPAEVGNQNSALETGTTRPICKGYMYL